MARLSTYTKDVNLTGKDMLTGSNYVTTVNGIDQFETNNFTLKKLSDYFIGQITGDPSQLSLKSNGGLFYETVNDTNFLAVNLSHTNITGQLANSDLLNSTITINSTVVPLGGSIDIPVGDITAVNAGTYLNGGGETGDVTLNHDTTSRSDTEASSTITSTFTAITSITSNATGHITSEETTTYTLPTDIYVDSAAVTGTTTKTITLGRTGGQSNVTADFTDNDNYADTLNITGDTTKTVTIGRTGSLLDLTATFDDNDNYVDSITVTEPTSTTKRITIGRTGSLGDLTADFDDNDTIPNDATITLSAGTYISGGGDFTTDQSANETIAFNHDNTTRTDTNSSVQPNYGEDFTVIDTLTSNATGHITAANVKTVTLPDAVVPNDGLLDINEGTDISLTITGGDFSADKDTETDIIINHANITRSPNTTSSVGPDYGDSFTAIDSITSSATGHITVANLKTITLPNGPNDNIITLSAGTYLSGGGNFTVDQSFDETLTINHDSTTRSDTTSTVSPAHGESFTAVDSVTTNATGHITGINVKTITLPDDDNTDILQRISADSTNAERYVTFVNSATGDLQAGSNSTFRFNPSTNKLTVTNLEVTGTQTINNVEVINTSGGIVFEGSVDDAYETTFNVINPTADRAINLPNKSGTVALLDDIPTVNDGTLTVQGSSGLAGSGTFTANDADSPTITISHADTSSQPSVNNVNNDFIQDIILDDYGHVTSITSATAQNTVTQIREDNGSYRTGNITLQSGTNVTITEPSTGVFNFAATNTQPNNGLLDINQGSGISLVIGGGDFTADKATTTTIDISHADTSSQSSVNNTGNAFIQDITLDTYGHVTGLNSTTVSIGNGTLTINTAGIASGGGTFTANQSGNSTITITATEADTLATVTGRGNTTSATISVNQVIATNNGNGTNYRIGDDVWIGDINLANTFRVQGVQDSTKGYITFGSSSNDALGRAGTGALTWAGNTIWHSGNDGAGTGLDADLLDGVQGNQFLRSTTSPGTPGTNANTTISIGDSGTSYAYVQSHGSKPLNFNPSGNTVQVAGNRILTTLDINYLSYSGSNNFIVYGSQNNLGSSIPTNAIIVYQDTGASQIVSRGYVSDLPFLTSYTETDTLSTVTSRGNTTGLLKVETGSIGESNAGTAGLIINGNYTNGQYSHRWRKQDPGGNVPLYLDQSGPTANSYTWQARFGAYSGNSITFEVNGSIKANGDMHCTRLYDINTTYYFDGSDTGDSIRVAGDVIAYYSSDKRYKDNITNISNPLDKINKIGGYTFEWNEVSHKETGKKDIGVIAQEIEEIFPEIVQTRENGYKAVDYPKLTALLIEAVKELSGKVKALENGSTK